MAKQYKATLSRIKNKLDAVAINQLRQEVSDLAKQLEESETARMYAEDDADFWREQVTSLNEQISETDCSLGINKQGEVLLLEH